jgi:hypothetical protein
MKTNTNMTVKYGVAPPFKEIGIGKQNFRRKKMFGNPIEDDDAV